ncbi:hypothetical protein SISNIDRAFT_472465 [Sistotremastrum niveocremeum HHB9708]|uniref:Transcription factor domain-containing protein n=1 Tax=Sistotremastrum niveocremeum HHB9708 TaxID=1314777 RepID=A0A165A8U7_9AGAM|nr:hypothetical protein SISNIDRAFT_472465 [Sistotremastrum niveocremeum HHB9708]
MQPSLVLAGLALATLMRSSEIGLGQSGRLQALELRNAAQASLQSSYESGWIDTTLAQAALILALFEASAHPDHTAERAATSLLYLDWIIKRLNLTRLDEHDPETSTFTQTAVPVVPRQSPIPGQANCGCTPSYRLPSGDISTSPIWNCAPDWDPRWSLADVRREESRRLCWSALTLVAAHTADCAAFGRKPLDLELIKPSNYALLFPGEILSRTQPAPLHPPKESVWALYSRSMLLWISCIEQSRAETSDGEKAEFAMQAWMEASVIEDALNFHACHIEQASLFVGRDYIFNRKKAIDWLKYQIGVANRVKATLNVLTEGQTQILSNRPFYVWWFMGQIAISLSLWSFDNSLTQALELCHAFLKPVDILTALWPCAVQRARYADLRAKLTDACVAAGMTPPLPADFVAPLSTSL